MKQRIGAMLAKGTFASFEAATTVCHQELRIRNEKYTTHMEGFRSTSSSQCSGGPMDDADEVALERLRIAHAIEIASICLLEGRSLHLGGDLPGSERVLHAANVQLRNEVQLCNPEQHRQGTATSIAALRAASLQQRRHMIRLQNELSDEQRMVRDMQARRECGNTEFRNVKYAKAYDAYTGALQVDPCHDAYNAILYCNRAAALMMLGLFAEALNDCDEALKRRVYYPKAKQRRANALRSNGQLADARAELEQLRVEMTQRGDHRRVPTTPLQKLFGIDYRTVEQEYNEIIAMLATEEERKNRTKSRFSRFGSSGYGSSGGPPGSPRYRESRRHSSTGSSGYGGSGSSSSSSSNDYQRSGGRAHQNNYNGARDSKNRRNSSHHPQQPSEPDAYAVLGVDRSASTGAVKKAFHKLALKYHPDKVKANTTGSNEDPAAVFKRINEAYSKLKDPASKRLYDMQHPPMGSGYHHRRSSR